MTQNVDPPFDKDEWDDLMIDEDDWPDEEVEEEEEMLPVHRDNVPKESGLYWAKNDEEVGWMIVEVLEHAPEAWYVHTLRGVPILLTENSEWEWGRRARRTDGAADVVLQDQLDDALKEKDDLEVRYTFMKTEYKRMHDASLVDSSDNSERDKQLAEHEKELMDEIAELKKEVIFLRGQASVARRKSRPFR